ncbi:uncharacterized protein [Hemitrygon akajei]|uniref:uncharacterized protein isoform X1 n=1 Tax=Hemitrygon akajei TaxID=2704970 RepID=UPI003BF9CD24
MNLPPISKQWTGRNPAENHLSGKTLRGEIRMDRRPRALGPINQSCAETLNQNEKLTTIGSPNQQLIDKILVRRRYEWFVKKEEHHAQNRKLEELKESLKKELYELHLQKKHLKTEFMIPSHIHDDQSALQARIIQIKNNLPAMEDRIKELSCIYYRLRNTKHCEKKLISYNEEEGAEPYQIRNINMVRSILNDMVENLMDDYIQKVPDGADCFSVEHLAQKNMQETNRLMKQVEEDRVTSLIMEQFVLEVTHELSSEVAEEIYKVSQMIHSLAFDVIFNAVQENRNQRQKQSGNVKHTLSSDHLVTLLLEQQKDRELHRKGLWGSHPTLT